MSKFNLFLPSTSFPLKRQAGSDTTFTKVVTTHPQSDGFDFLLHDGPPYANGNLHLGHFLNKVLKDSVNRHQERFNGKTVSFRPGWDCHGLPIEVKVEEQYTKAGKSKDADVVQFRKDCRAYADSWVDVQKEEFKSFGVRAEWDKCYKTHDYEYEAETLKNLYGLQERGLLEQRFRPVHWSPVEKTTLAEAELESVSLPLDSLFVEFPVEGENYSVLVWTTTPWTLPGNKAVAYNSDATYKMGKTPSGKYVVMNESAGFMLNQELGLEFVRNFDPNELKGKFVNPPFGGRSPLLEENDSVNEHAGSGFLHVVPGHGFDDFKLGVKYNLNLEGLVDDDAMMEVNGVKVHVYKANQAVKEYLESRPDLVYYYELHRVSERQVSWRSKKPVVVKTKKNWFFNFDSFKDKLLEEVDEVNWNSTGYANRFKFMFGDRSEWCLSRQRLWGVPMALFLHNETGEMLVDPEVNTNVVKMFKEHSSDVWYEHDADFFLPEKYHGQYQKVMDVLDVWFDSGSSLKAVYPDVDRADMYLEGTDQHRGWFQSSALVHYALYGKLPFKNVFTHGFVLQRRQKMSKSVGNGGGLPDLLEKYGADVMRLWLLSGFADSDVEFDEEKLKQTQANYDKVRNTVRFCLANLNGEVVNQSAELLPVDRYVLYKAKELVQSQCGGTFPTVRKALAYVRWVSEFYFTQVKDSLYCDSKGSNRRQAVLYTLDRLVRTLLYVMEPTTPFLVAEVSQYGFDPSYCLNDLDCENLGYWEFVENERDEVLKAFEDQRSEQKWQMEQMVVCFKSPLPVDWKEVLGCAQYKNEQVGTRTVHFEVYNGEKCLRCRTYYAKVNDKDMCQRCEDVENEYGSSV
ncbi:MAG: class I tRNA ligase family protein [Gammaproteobacteria bacterium]|nr:class I tRNA ligase family protein [Gammaproteobacteria bacterium]